MSFQRDPLPQGKRLCNMVNQVPGIDMRTPGFRLGHGSSQTVFGVRGDSDVGHGQLVGLLDSVVWFCRRVVVRGAVAYILIA